MSYFIACSFDCVGGAFVSGKSTKTFAGCPTVLISDEEKDIVRLII